ncbi:MAG: heavy-metal-associated domain-containing protein, partial [bacterium]
MNLLKCILLLFAITVCSGFAQIESKIKVAPDSSALFVVKFGVDDKKGDRAGLQNLQTERLHAIEGVRYVSANYKSGEVVVRYLSSKVTLERLLAELEKLSENRISLLKDPETIDSSKKI